MDARRIVEILTAELANLDKEPHVPIVCRDNCGDDWCIYSFRPFKHDHRPTWREAYDLGYNLSRVSHVSLETIKEMP